MAMLFIEIQILFIYNIQTFVFFFLRILFILLIFSSLSILID